MLVVNELHFKNTVAKGEGCWLNYT